MSVGFNITEDDDYVETFLDHIRNQNGSTIDQFEIPLRFLQKYLDQNHPETDIDEVTPRLVKEWVREDLQQNRGNASSSILTRLSYLSSFYEFYATRGVMENPVPIAKNDLNLDTNGGRELREIILEDMRDFVQQISNPQMRAATVLFLKTGIRNGELCNLDLRDIHLDHERYKRHYSVEPRSQIEGKPDSLYVSNRISEGDVVNGEERKSSNKRSVPTIFPIDTELKRALLGWLACRPDTPSHHAKPLFLLKNRVLPERYTQEAMANQITKRAEEHGWWTPTNGNEDASQNVSPHYFRHYFVTHHRETTENGRAISDSVLRYLRGDSDASDMLDTYTQNWGLNVREVYLNNVYQLCTG